MSESCGADQARDAVKKISDLNVDDLVRISSFTPECIQVCTPVAAAAAAAAEEAPHTHTPH